MKVRPSTRSLAVACGTACCLITLALQVATAAAAAPTVRITGQLIARERVHLVTIGATPRAIRWQLCPAAIGARGCRATPTRIGIGPTLRIPPAATGRALRANVRIGNRTLRTRWSAPVTPALHTLLRVPDGWSTSGTALSVPLPGWSTIGFRRRVYLAMTRDMRAIDTALRGGRTLTHTADRPDGGRLRIRIDLCPAGDYQRQADLTLDGAPEPNLDAAGDWGILVDLRRRPLTVRLMLRPVIGTRTAETIATPTAPAAITIGGRTYTAGPSDACSQ